jgi:hypothetical protein
MQMTYCSAVILDIDVSLHAPMEDSPFRMACYFPHKVSLQAALQGNLLLATSGILLE